MTTSVKPAKFVAIDASTNSLAFALFEFGKLEIVGKIAFEGNNIYQKCIDASKKNKGSFRLGYVFKFINYY